MELLRIVREVPGGRQPVSAGSSSDPGSLMPAFSLAGLGEADLSEHHLSANVSVNTSQPRCCTTSLIQVDEICPFAFCYISWFSSADVAVASVETFACIFNSLLKVEFLSQNYKHL